MALLKCLSWIWWESIECFPLQRGVQTCWRYTDRHRISGVSWWHCKFIPLWQYSLRLTLTKYFELWMFTVPFSHHPISRLYSYKKECMVIPVVKGIFGLFLSEKHCGQSKSMASKNLESWPPVIALLIRKPIQSSSKERQIHFSYSRLKNNMDEMKFWIVQ